MKNEEGVFILICALLVTGAIWGFAKWIGADPTITFAAIGYSVLVLAIGVAIWFLIHPKLDVLACVTATALWPCWGRLRKRNLKYVKTLAAAVAA